jgi:hypothetical protein
MHWQGHTFCATFPPLICRRFNFISRLSIIGKKGLSDLELMICCMLIFFASQIKISIVHDDFKQWYCSVIDRKHVYAPSISIILSYYHDHYHV